MRKVVVLLLVAVLTALALSSASAQFDLTLATNSLTGAPGDVLTLYGTIRNTGPYSMYLYSGYTWWSGYLDVDYARYIPTYSERLFAPGEVWSGPLLDVHIIRYSSFVSNCGISIEWPSSDLNESRDYATYQVTVVPEPSSLMALACGVTGIGGALLRRRRSG